MQNTQQKQVQKTEQTEESVQINEQKTYIKTNLKWKDLPLKDYFPQCMLFIGKSKPTRVQSQAIQFACNKNRKRFNLLIRAMNGSGKTLAFLIPLINSLSSGVKITKDKLFRGKTLKDQIFAPQAIIVIQNILLQSQLFNYLSEIKQYGQTQKVDQLDFKIGLWNLDGHTQGDIVICMAKSLNNRSKKQNLSLQNCKFVAFDQIDDIANQDRQTLQQVLKLIKQKSNANIISCSATMQRSFIQLYKSIDPDFTTLDINKHVSDQLGQSVSLQGVRNYKCQIQMKQQKDLKPYFDFVIKDLFKQIYTHSQFKPQIFIFFNSVEQIRQFEAVFESYSSDFTDKSVEHLQSLSKDVIAARVYRDGKKVDLSVDQKNKTIAKFRNGQTNLLLCTNIMARGIDIRSATFVINIEPPKNSNKHIDIDTYLHRVGRTGRHNDKGIALTIGCKQQLDKLTQLVLKVHKVNIKPMQSSQEIAKLVAECIVDNAKK